MTISKQFSDIDTLHQIDLSLLKTLIDTHSDYFTPYHVIIGDNVNYNNLQQALLQANTPQDNNIPADLLDVLYSVSEMQKPDVTDELLETLHEMDAG